MNDLEWLARNIGEDMPSGARFVIKNHECVNYLVYPLIGSHRVSDVLAKRAELINKPDFLPGYPWLAKDRDGDWYGFTVKPTHDNSVFFSDEGLNKFICVGEALDNWKESLCFNNTANKTLDNAFDDISKPMGANFDSSGDKVYLVRFDDPDGDATFEEVKVQEWNGEGLPPVGTVCERIGCMSSDKWEKIEVKAYYQDQIAYVFDGELVVSFVSDSQFRPINPQLLKNLEKINDIINKIIINEKPLERAQMIMEALEDET